jgi:hypothetical protein
MMKSKVLSIIDDEIEKLRASLTDADDTKLLFIAHTIGAIQELRRRFENEVQE